MGPSAEKLANVQSFQNEITNPRADGSTANAPLLVAIEATTRCNFKCVHCARAFTKDPATDISLELFQALVPASRLALEVYLFGDGEVLLDVPRHLAMISRIYRQNPGCALGFSTNGKLLTAGVYELYSTAGIQYIQVSVDAATKELYEAMRRGGSFDELLLNLDGIAAWRRQSTVRQPDLYLATVISKQNFRQLPALAQFAKDYGFSDWYINVECPQTPHRDLLSLTAEDLRELQCMRAEIVDAYRTSFTVRFDSSIGLPPEKTEKWLEQPSPVFCAAPWQQFEVKANGDVQVCPYFAPSICSMNGKSFAEVWNGREFRQVRKAFASGKGLPAGCTTCSLGMRKQFLPGSPSNPVIPRVSLSGWIHGGVVKMREFISA